MDKVRLEGNWNELKGELKEQYGELTDDALPAKKAKKTNCLEAPKRNSLFNMSTTITGQVTQSPSPTVVGTGFGIEGFSLLYEVQAYVATATSAQ